MTTQVSEFHHWLNQFQHPLLIEQWAQCQGVVTVDESNHSVAIELPFAVSHLEASLEQWLSESTRPASLSGFSISVSRNVKALQSKVASTLPKVKNVIAVTSAKGGVGKSTTTANLALAITELGAKVGVLDADIYGPSIPLMFGTQGQKMQVVDDKWMQPIEAYDVFTQSIGYLMSQDDAAVWRGPMASKALVQLLNETQWPELDYLIIDMPPGTGDLQITLAQQIPLTAAIIVTTPQDLALADAVKGIAMFEKVEVPVLGIVENMSYHECSQCGFQENIFGSGGAIKLAADKGIPVLGQLPLHINIRQDIDLGCPSVVNPTSSHQAKDYLSFAEQVVSRLFWQGKPKLDSINFVELR